MFLRWLGSNSDEFNSDGGFLSLEVCPSHLVSLKAMVDVAKVGFQPPCPLRRRRKLRDPMRNTATTPTSVRKFHWIVPYQIIVQPSKYQLLHEGGVAQELGVVVTFMFLGETALPCLLFAGQCSIMSSQCSLAEIGIVHKDNLSGKKKKKAGFFPLLSLSLSISLKQYIILGGSNVVRSSHLLSSAKSCSLSYWPVVFITL